MGISKIGPNLYFIKARAKVLVKVQTKDGVREIIEDRRRQERFSGNKAQAETRYLEIKGELREERKQARTFGDLLETYRESRGWITGSQASVYKTLTRDLGAVDILELEQALKRYYPLLKSMPSKKTGVRLGAAALNRARTMVAAALNLAVATKVLAESPLNGAVWPKAPEVARDRFLSELEIQRLLNVLELEASHLVPIARFALQVPCRKSELVRMGRGDLDLFHNAIRVHNGTTKNEDGAWKPIPPELIGYFRSLPAECPYLFYRVRAGKYLPLGDFKKSWTRALRLAGIRNFHFHDTRHIAATEMVDAGTPERVVMDVAGWRTNMLSTYYKSSSKKALGLVRFASGRGNQGATSDVARGNGAENGTERAVS